MQRANFKVRTLRVVIGLAVGLLGVAGCGKSDPAPSITPAPTPATLSAPVPVGPAGGSSSVGWPTFTTLNASRTGNVGAVTYKFEIATDPNFTAVVTTATVPEGSGQTTYKPDATVAAPQQGLLYWRVSARDQSNGLASSASGVQQFRYLAVTDQNRIALAQGVVIWPGAAPVGTYGHAQMGPGWDPRVDTSFDGVSHQVPTIEQLRVFDLLDLGLDPFAALDWMRSNGYGTSAVYYPSVQAIGFPFEYIALVLGRWELVHRVGA